MSTSSPPLTIHSTTPLPIQIPSSSPPSTQLPAPIRIPLLGLGAYDLPHSTLPQVIHTALSTNYTHIDSAIAYDNSPALNHALRTAVPRPSRSALFLTTKIYAPSPAGPDATYAAALAAVLSLARGLDPDSPTSSSPDDDDPTAYVDLFLVHTADGGPTTRRELWTALERLHHSGRARSIGVSNWPIAHIRELRTYARIYPPAVNQLELHPWCQQRGVVEFCRGEGIVVQAYSPLARGVRAGDRVLGEVAARCGRSWAQVLVRYALQKGWVPLPRSGRPERVRENADVYGWEIGEEDMERLDALDLGAEGAVVRAVDEGWE